LVRISCFGLQGARPKVLRGRHFAVFAVLKKSPLKKYPNPFLRIFSPLSAPLAPPGGSAAPAASVGPLCGAMLYLEYPVPIRSRALYLRALGSRHFRTCWTQCRLCRSSTTFGWSDRAKMSARSALVRANSHVLAQRVLFTQSI
jgi:hypothetical protein